MRHCDLGLSNFPFGKDADIRRFHNIWLLAERANSPCDPKGLLKTVSLPSAAAHTAPPLFFRFSARGPGFGAGSTGDPAQQEQAGTRPGEARHLTRPGRHRQQKRPQAPRDEQRHGIEDGRRRIERFDAMALSPKNAADPRIGRTDGGVAAENFSEMRIVASPQLNE